MSYPSTPSGAAPYAHPYHAHYPVYPNAGTPTGMQPPYPYMYGHGQIPPGYMPQGGHPVFGMPGAQGYYRDADDGSQDEEDEEAAMMEDEEEVDEEMPLDQQSAEKAMKHMIYTQLFLEGFDGGRESAVNRLLHEIVAFMQKLYQATQEYGSAAGRSAPSAQDFVAACADLGITPEMLKPKRKPGSSNLKKDKKAEHSAGKPKRRRRKRRTNFDPRHANLIPRDLSSPEPELLPSEDMPHVPATLRSFHNVPYLPSYPPKHTYIRSPPSPPQRSSLTANLDKRMQNTAKVRAALKNLMDAADLQDEDGGKQGDGKPKFKLTQSSLVNWQDSFSTTRKRWKVSK